MLASAVAANAQDNVSVVDVPTANGTAAQYVTYRAPLQAAPLLKLPIGAVQPQGWLREYLIRQKNGLNGELGTVSDWLDKNNNQWLSDAGSHGWEEVPYWIRGYSALAFILGDDKMINETKFWLDAVLNNVKANGELGPSGTDGDPNTPDLWAKMPMLWALQTYYDATDDEEIRQKIITAMTNYFKWELSIPDDHFLKGLWQEKRGGDNEWSVVWLYNRTGDESILPVIDKLHRCGVDWMLKGDLPNWHGVNVAQGFREPATYYLHTGNKDALQAVYDNFNEMRQRYGQVPGGMYAADENARQGYFDPRQGAETCALVEHMASDEIMMGITGDPFWADHCENVAFNTFTAALTPDMRALRYLTSPNMAISDEKKHGPSIDNDLKGMLSMSPFSSRCCQHNHGMGWPYYTEHLVMATTDGGLATMLYAESVTTAKVAGGKEIKLTEETHYPFEGDVNFTISTTANVTFPLYLRIPAWAAGATVAVNGENVAVANATGKYVRIEREWKNNDKVSLSLPMQITTQTWQQNKASVSVNYGPLTLSLNIDIDWEQHDSKDPEFNQEDSHWQADVDASKWPCYVLKPKSKWNYAIKLDDKRLPLNIKVTKKDWPANNFPFTPESVPLEFEAVGREIPSWGYDATGITDQLPTKWVQQSETDTTIKLIPMGAARLRISAFPVAK